MTRRRKKRCQDPPPPPLPRRNLIRNSQLKKNSMRAYRARVLIMSNTVFL